MSSQKYMPTYKTVIRSLSGGQTEVIYYETAIVRFDDREIQLNTGGWWTATTMSRMNQVSRNFDLGFRVHAKNNTWFVDYRDTTFRFSTTKIRLDRTTGAVSCIE